MEREAAFQAAVRFTLTWVKVRLCVRSGFGFTVSHFVSLDRRYPPSEYLLIGALFIAVGNWRHKLLPNKVHPTPRKLRNSRLPLPCLVIAASTKASPLDDG